MAANQTISKQEQVTKSVKLFYYLLKPYLTISHGLFSKMIQIILKIDIGYKSVFNLSWLLNNEYQPVSLPF